MYLKEFRYLLTIAEEGNITRAANRLYISQASLSHFLTEYEKDMEFKIFTRSHFGVKPTEPGKKLLEIAERTMKEMDAIVPKHLHPSPHDQVKINIGIPDQRGMMLTPYFLSRAKQELPQIQFHVIEDTPNKLKAMLYDDVCSLFIAAAPTRDNPYPELKCSFLCKEEIQIAIPPGHRLNERIRVSAADEPYVTISDLKGLDYCLCNGDRNIRLFSDQFLKDQNIPHNVISTSSNIATAINSCLAFNALTFVPKKFAYINSNLTYLSIGRKKVYWYLQVISKQDMETAPYYAGITKIFRDYYL